MALKYYSWSTLANDAMDAYVKNSNPEVFLQEKRDRANTKLIGEAVIAGIGEGVGLAGYKVASRGLEILGIAGDATDAWRQQQAESETENSDKKKKDTDDFSSIFSNGAGGSVFSPGNINNFINQRIIQINLNSSANSPQNQQSRGGASSGYQIQLLRQLVGLYQQLFTAIQAQNSSTNTQLP